MLFVRVSLSRTRTWLTLVLLLSLVMAGLTGLASNASADTSPASGTPATVSDDALPTVQQNGVVWAQVTVGNIVYATGSFSQTWPAGTTASSSNETARSNLLAYNITTGALVTSFNHSLNAQGLGISASPDGKTVYVVGDFTTVDGLTRNHIAAFDTATGNLSTTFAPSISGSAAAVAVNSSTVYVGGNFQSAGGATRVRLAAFTASTGALLSWAPTADDQQVNALVLSPDGSRVIVGGRFTTINGQAASGLGAVDPTSGALLPFAINGLIQDGGNGKCGITTLSVDGNQVYGGGFSFGCGNFEGRFAADPDTGKAIWINDCHGDTYSTYPIGSVLYSVGHAHDCSSIGGFPDTNPRTWHRALAETTAASGSTDTGPDSYGWNYSGQPDATQLDWYPSLSTGTVTGQSQAGWSVTGNASYVSIGGEFPSVNGTAQAGLVRFAVASIAPNKVGPQVVGSNWKIAATSLGAGSVRVTFPSNWDPDNTTLTYKVYRDTSTSTPVYTTTTNSTFWKLPTLGFVDTGLTPGSSHQYKVFASDPYGNTTNSSWVTVTVATSGTGATSTYAKDVLGDGASDYWRLGESSGTTAYDYAGFDDMTEPNGVTQGAAGSISGDAGTASTFDGSSQFAATSDLITGPNTFSLEGWFKTTSTSGGVIAGFGNSNTSSVSNNYDRHIYMDSAGHVTFGVYNNSTYTVSTSNTYNDGSWHYVVGTLSSAGVTLYVDGKAVGTNTGTTVGQAYSGYWRIGGDNQNGWPNAGSSNYFAGSIDDVAVYPTALSVSQIRTHYLDAGGTIPGAAPPVAAFTSSTNNLAASFDATTSTDTSGTITGYSWDFGDNTTGTGATPSHTYTTAGTYTVVLTVTDSNSNAGSVSKKVTVTVPNQPPVAAFTSSCSAAACSFDASGSSDPDGTIASYAWDFGDNSTGSGQTTSHTYAASGTDTVTLTVTDNAGATTSITHQVSPVVSTVLASDAFQRTVASGWGTADTIGGAWSAGSASSVLSVTPGAGTLTVNTAGKISSAYLPSVNTTDSDTTVVLTPSAVASGGMYADVIARRVSSTTDYRARVHLLANGTVGISLLDNVSGTQNVLKGETIIKGLTYTPGTTLSIRVQAFGSTTSTVQAKVWATGSTQPTAWQVSTTDSTAALQVKGSVGVSEYVPSASTNVPLSLKVSSFQSQPSGN